MAKAKVKSVAEVRSEHGIAPEPPDENAPLVPATNPERWTFDFSGDELYLLVIALDCAAHSLSQSRTMAQRLRSLQYRALAERLDRVYASPSLGKLALAK
jgi:hypothetical protein